MTLSQSVEHLAQQMMWLEQIAYREWTPRKKESGIHSSYAPLAIEDHAWDLLQACIQAMQDVWYESGHMYSPEWHDLINLIQDDMDYITHCSNVNEWTTAIDTLTTRAEQITKSQPDLDPKGVLVLTPSQLADHLARTYQISCSPQNTKDWLRRGNLKAKQLGDGYWAITITSIQALAAKRKPSNL